MQLTVLTACLTFSTQRSFSAAARRLHRTQPAISQAVRRIEDEVGERLCDRPSREGALTEAVRLVQDYPHGLLEGGRVTTEEVGQEVVIGHNDPSPTRDRELRAYERRRTSINIQISLPSLDGIKRAVEMGIGVALLPRRCALTEIARGHLAAVKVPELGAPRQVRLAFRKTGERSRAAEAFLEGVGGRG